MIESMIQNPNPAMAALSGQTVKQFGQDRTGLISYTFNRQGFRSSYDFDFKPRYVFFGVSLVFGVGVPEEETFAYLCTDSHNYGLAGKYDNADTMQLMTRFMQSPLYNQQVRIVVVWHLRDTNRLAHFYSSTRHHDRMLHFFCGDPLPQPRCLACPGDVDRDVSGTHAGPKTHRLFFETIHAHFETKPLILG